MWKEVVMELKCLSSIQTLKFNTVDGDIHTGQYAFHGGVYYIRDKSELTSQPKELVPVNPLFDNPDAVINIPERISGLTEVLVVPNESAYYDFFELPNGEIYRSKSDKIKYEDLAKSGATKVVKDVTQKEIDDIKKEKAKWL